MEELLCMISNPKTTKEELKDLVYTDDVTTLLGDGLEKIILGLTTFKELFKLVEVDLEIKALKDDIERRKKKKIEKYAESIMNNELEVNHQSNVISTIEQKVNDEIITSNTNDVMHQNINDEKIISNNITKNSEDVITDEEIIDEVTPTSNNEVQPKLNDVIPDKIQTNTLDEYFTDPNKTNIYDLDLNSSDEIFYDE